MLYSTNKLMSFIFCYANAACSRPTLSTVILDHLDEGTYVHCTASPYYRAWKSIRRQHLGSSMPDPSGVKHAGRRRPSSRRRPRPAKPVTLQRTHSVKYMVTLHGNTLQITRYQLETLKQASTIVKWQSGYYGSCSIAVSCCIV